MRVTENSSVLRNLERKCSILLELMPFGTKTNIFFYSKVYQKYLLLRQRVLS